MFLLLQIATDVPEGQVLLNKVTIIDHSSKSEPIK